MLKLRFYWWGWVSTSKYIFSTPLSKIFCALLIVIAMSLIGVNKQICTLDVYVLEPRSLPRSMLCLQVLYPCTSRGPPTLSRPTCQATRCQRTHTAPRTNDIRTCTFRILFRSPNPFG
jgi:hypothetical protein